MVENYLKRKYMKYLIGIALFVWMICIVGWFLKIVMIIGAIWIIHHLIKPVKYHREYEHPDPTDDPYQLNGPSYDQQHK